MVLAELVVLEVAVVVDMESKLSIKEYPSSKSSNGSSTVKVLDTTALSCRPSL